MTRWKLLFSAAFLRFFSSLKVTREEENSPRNSSEERMLLSDKYSYYYKGGKEIGLPCGLIAFMEALCWPSGFMFWNEMKNHGLQDR